MRNINQLIFDVTLQRKLDGGVSESIEAQVNLTQNEGFTLSDNEGKDILKLVWADTRDFEFDDLKKSVAFENSQEIVISFESERAYTQFYDVHNQKAPRVNPFIDFRGTIVERKPTLVTKESEEQEDLFVFEIFKFKSRIFSESSWMKHQLILEKYQSQDLSL